MKFVINPGTKAIKDAKFKNAKKAAEYFLEDIGIKGMSFEKGADVASDRGWFGFEFKKGEFKITVDFLGSDPDVTRRGEAWKSPRIYVDGSSWLWGFGIDIFTDRYKEHLLEMERK